LEGRDQEDGDAKPVSGKQFTRPYLGKKKKKNIKKDEQSGSSCRATAQQA
jgi:hypothetical protein